MATRIQVVYFLADGRAATVVLPVTEGMQAFLGRITGTIFRDCANISKIYAACREHGPGFQILKTMHTRADGNRWKKKLMTDEENSLHNVQSVMNHLMRMEYAIRDNDTWKHPQKQMDMQQLFLTTEDAAEEGAARLLQLYESDTESDSENEDDDNDNRQILRQKIHAMLGEKETRLEVVSNGERNV